MTDDSPKLPERYIAITTEGRTFVYDYAEWKSVSGPAGRMACA